LTLGDPLIERYRRVRGQSVALCAPLSAEDHMLQAMTEASPPKWHLAHTTWFFETFVLQPHKAGYEAFHPSFCYLFNSYYEAIGDRHPRGERGLLSRPSLDEVHAWRRSVDDHMYSLLEDEIDPALAERIELGLQHEQQHQELTLTDLKAGFARNALSPAYRAESWGGGSSRTVPLRFVEVEGGMADIGHRGGGFCFDNEGPHHRVPLSPFLLASRLVTCGEFLEFIEDGGYGDPRLWLSDGWAWRSDRGIQAPLYWRRVDGNWQQFTLAGLRAVEDAEPVTHISYYEADAYATWCGRRLPTEFEWEHVLGSSPVSDLANFAGSQRFHPCPARPTAEARFQQGFGDCWEWTRSPYAPYPGYRPPAGAVGEYNGKFMINQMVLRGGSCATPADHIRGTYRNFFYPGQRWQFTGLRLAEDRGSQTS
jgi:ergothioneine biosynthesis protein EgtB